MKQSGHTWLYVAIPAFTIFVIFQNHYSRDTVGALEKQIENDLELSPSVYNTINTLYFVPNIFAPLFTGLLIELCGSPAYFLVYSAILGAIGHVLFAIGAAYRMVWTMYLGRFFGGTVYEIIDTIPIVMMGPLFKGSWGFIVGVMNGCLRLGTVFTFAISPQAYKYYGVVAALWISAFIAILGVGSSIVALLCDLRLEAALKELEDETNSDIEMSEDKLLTNEQQVLLEGASKNYSATDNDYDLTKNVPAENVAIHGNQEHHQHLDNEDRASVLSEDRVFIALSRGSSFAHHDNDDFHSGLRHCCYILFKAIPIHDYGPQFYFYLFNGMFLFGAMVPFWFIGSKFFQMNYILNVEHADALMLMPEGAMVVVSPILGLSLDKFRLSLPFKLQFLGVSCLTMTVAFFLLAFGYSHSADSGDGAQSKVLIPPLGPMLLLGLSYACANSLTWDAIVYILPDPAVLAPASGLYASALNVLPAILPHVITYVSTLGYAGGDEEMQADIIAQSNAGMIILGITAVVGAVCAFFSSLYGTPDDPFSHHASSAKA